MSDLRKTLAAVVVDRQRFTGDAVINLSNGRQFIAELEDIQDIELNEALGRDAREAVTMRVTDQTIAAELVLSGYVSVPSYGVNGVFQLVRKTNNPVSIQIEFGLKRKVPGIDT